MPATGSGEGGTTFLLDLPQATALRDGDGLVLDDSSIVRVGTASAVDPTRKALM
jgi:urease accessory protein UreE